MRHMIHMFIPVLDVAFCLLCLLLLPVNAAHSTKKMWIAIRAILQHCWLSVALNPSHQSPQTVRLHLYMNVRSFRARLLERLWGNPVSQFWHLISIKHRNCYADWLEWKDSVVSNIILLKDVFLWPCWCELSAGWKDLKHNTCTLVLVLFYLSGTRMHIIMYHVYGKNDEYCTGLCIRSL